MRSGDRLTEGQEAFPAGSKLTGATYRWILGEVSRGLRTVSEEEWPFVPSGGEVRCRVAWGSSRWEGARRPRSLCLASQVPKILGVFPLEGSRRAANAVNPRVISVPRLLKLAVAGLAGCGR